MCLNTQQQVDFLAQRVIVLAQCVIDLNEAITIIIQNVKELKISQTLLDKVIEITLDT